MIPKYKFNLGDTVVHCERNIAGRLIAVFESGFAEVKFGIDGDYVEIKNLESINNFDSNDIEDLLQKRDALIKEQSQKKANEKYQRERQRAEELAANEIKTRKIIQLKADEKNERELRERAANAEQEMERKHSKQIRHFAEERRDDFINKIQIRFKSNFIDVNEYFQRNKIPEFSEVDYNKEKKDFVKFWLENTFNGKEGAAQLPDDEQLTAISAVNSQVQVIARAGSGKTATLVNRAFFLQKHCNVAPSQMLLLAFNRKAVLEIRRRLVGLLNDGAELAVAEEIARRRIAAAQKNRNVRDDLENSVVDAIAAKLNVVLPHIMTFHALAHSIVHPDGTILVNGPDGTEQVLSSVCQQVIDDHFELPEFNARIRKLMLAHFREDWDRIVNGGYNQSKDELLKFRRSLPRESLGGDYVKSYGEKVIADFLFEHGIAYKYERNHWWNGINYRPDFTIFTATGKNNESGVIIEYFGLTGDTDYDLMSEDKRSYWAGKKLWTLVDFSPADIATDGVKVFLDRLKSVLEKIGFICIRLSEDEIWQRVRERAIDRFTKAVVGFIGRCRKMSWSPVELQTHIDSHVAQSPVEEMFLNLAQCLYRAYLLRLSETGEDDFDGLMQRAADNINAGQTLFYRKAGGGDLKALRYVCIDEYQDFSDLFFRLLSAIRKQNLNLELFCVGDDWQAINGFAGSDLKFFQNFSEYIGESRKLYISTNYRSSKAIVDVGNALMHGFGQPALAHKNSAGKVLLSDLNLFEPTLLEKKRHPGDCLTPAVLRVANQSLADGRDVVMLCRRNGLPYFVNYAESSVVGGRGIDRFLNHVRSFFPKGLREKITISTAHKYKGLEKSVVIVLDAVGRSYPLIHPDWVFSRIFGDSPAKITKEERRLLYVALTRAIDRLVIFTDGRNRSPFLDEIEQNLSLNSLDWGKFPAVAALSDRRLIVQIKNQANRPWNSGTYAVKDQLQANRYNWHAVKQVWEKSFPADGFYFEAIRNEVWAASASGVDVTVFDDAETEVASYKLGSGVWKCMFDYLGVEAKSPDCQVGVVR